jgi:tetratricopeptide (TPR) repeat protein
MLILTGRFSGADSVLALTRERFPQNLVVSRVAGELQYARGAMSEYERTIDSAMASTNAGLRDWGRLRRADLELQRGHVGTFARLNAGGRRSFVTDALGLEDAIRTALIDAAVRRQGKRALSRIDSALARVPLGTLQPMRRPYYLTADTYARAGRPDRARAVVEEYFNEARTIPRMKVWRPGIDAVMGEIALAEGKPREAIEAFRRSDMYEDGPSAPCVALTYADLGRAFDAANEPDSAITMFEKYLNTPCPARGSYLQDGIYLANIYERLGQLYAARADTVRATRYLGKFVDLWKNADPDLQARVSKARELLAGLSSTRETSGRTPVLVSEFRVSGVDSAWPRRSRIGLEVRPGSGVEPSARRIASMSLARNILSIFEATSRGD